MLILASTALRPRTTIDITTLALAGIFQLATAPVGAHMVGRAVCRARQVREDLPVVDELADASADRSDTGGR